MKQSTKKSAVQLGGAIVGGVVGSIVPGVGTAIGASLGSALGKGISEMIPDDPLKKKIDVNVGQGNSYSPYMDTLGKSNVDVNTTMVEQGPTSLSKVFDVTNQAVQTGASLYSGVSGGNLGGKVATTPSSNILNYIDPLKNSIVKNNPVESNTPILDKYFDYNKHSESLLYKPKQSLTFPK